jgi:hypothetical protein
MQIVDDILNFCRKLLVYFVVFGDASKLFLDAEVKFYFRLGTGRADGDFGSVFGKELQNIRFRLMYRFIDSTYQVKGYQFQIIMDYLDF